MQFILNRKKRFLVINPNTGWKMTKQIEESIKRIKPEDVEIDVVTNEGGPVSIEGHTDEIVSAYYILKLIAKNQKEYDGYLIACFSNHPSIKALRELTGKPVVGIAEGACYMAAMAGNRFGIVTTSPKWVPMLKEAVECFKAEGKCAGVFSTNLSVTQLHELSKEEVEKEVLRTGKRALASGAEVLCLGCAGMSGLQERIERKLNIPVVDSCEAGFMMLYSLCHMGLYTSRICMYESNLPRETINMENDMKEFYI